MQTILSDLNAISDIEGSAIISRDGLVMVSQLPEGMNEDNVGAMSAAILSVANRGSQEFVGGDSQQILVKGENGYILINTAGSDAVLTVMTKSDTELDSILSNIKSSADKISALM